MNPPLTRPPKKSKLYGWQCSECDKSSDSELDQVKTSRRSRSIYSKESRESFTPKVKIKPVEPNPEEKPITQDINYEINTPTDATTNELNDTNVSTQSNTTFNASTEITNSYSIVNNSTEEVVISSKSSKKRRREKHRNRYSPDTGMIVKEHKRKRKKKSLDIECTPPNIPHPRITIKVCFLSIYYFILTLIILM